MRLGIDTGGTFTDFVLHDGDELRIHKVLSTPDAPERAILQGMQALGLLEKPLHLVHGSTVATNAVLEGKGVRTVFITNKGLKDVLLIGRQNRAKLYDLTPIAPPSLVQADLCLEVDVRLNARGEIDQTLTEQALKSLIDAVQLRQPEAVAVSLLFSFLDSRHEKEIAQALKSVLPAHVPVSISSEILPEYKEFERGFTTWLNAYVSPLIAGYLNRMEQQLDKAQIAIMQSTAQTCDALQASKQAVNLLLSGPAGGLEGARFVSKTAGFDQLMTLDMGGTSTDVALIKDQITLTSEGKIGEYPVSVPMVDIHTIGAGGGSIARIDTGGLLKVGPQSAGAMPGPVCYQQGGTQVTVTDANLVLGRLPASTRLGGEHALSYEKAHKALQKLAEQSGLTCAEEAALGVIEIANEHMAGALRVISVQRGEDPKDFVLVCFGGAGGLHVCDLADALQMHTALVPVHAGVQSALGMLSAKPGRYLSKTLAKLLSEISKDTIEKISLPLVEQGRQDLISEGIESHSISIKKQLELCYQGQSFTLSIPFENDLGSIAEQFHRLHEQRYGHRLSIPIELITVRIAVEGKTPAPELSTVFDHPRAEPIDSVKVFAVKQAVNVWNRSDLTSGQTLQQPAIITEKVSTTYLAEGWQCQVDSVGNLILKKKG